MQLKRQYFKPFGLIISVRFHNVVDAFPIYSIYFSKKILPGIIAEFYDKNVVKIIKGAAGRAAEFEAIKIAMYLCQELSGKFLKDIAEYFIS